MSLTHNWLDLVGVYSRIRLGYFLCQCIELVVCTLRFRRLINKLFTASSSNKASLPIFI